MARAKTEPTKTQILTLAIEAQVDPRTARRAIVYGVDNIKGEVVRERLRKAMRTRS
jgi:hypothetical protein